MKHPKSYSLPASPSSSSSSRQSPTSRSEFNGDSDGEFENESEEVSSEAYGNSKQQIPWDPSAAGSRRENASAQAQSTTSSTTSGQSPSSHQQPSARRLNARSVFPGITSRSLRSSASPWEMRLQTEARPKFIELLARSNFSFLQGASHPEEMVLTAKRLGYKGIAICDVNGLYGVVRGYQAAEKPSLFDAEQLAFANPDGTQKEPFHYMCGAELSPYDGSPLVLLPMNKDGYTRLCHLITKAKRRAPKGHIVLSVSDVCQSNDDLIVFPLPPWKEEVLLKLKDAFQDRLYLPVWRDFTWESVRAYQQALKLEKSLGLQLFATQRPLFHEPERKPLHDVLTCIMHKTTLDQASTRLALNRERYLKPLDQLGTLFRERPDLLARTLEIAARVDFSLSELRYKYPQENLPHGKTAADHLRDLVEAGLQWRYGDQIARAKAAQARKKSAKPSPREPTPPEHSKPGSREAGGQEQSPSTRPNTTDADEAAREKEDAKLIAFLHKVRKQVEHELSLISEMEYEDYFLTLFDICQFARKKGILHQGRGSAANSVVCFALGLTAIDPIKLGLLFERFISKERGEPPDIDIDFEHDRREEVIQYIYQKYGERRAAMVCTVICYRSRMAIREVAKVMGVPLDKVDALVKYMGREGLSRLLEAASDLQPSSEPSSPTPSQIASRESADDDEDYEPFHEPYQGAHFKGSPEFQDGEQVFVSPPEGVRGGGEPPMDHGTKMPIVDQVGNLPAQAPRLDLKSLNLSEFQFRLLLSLSLELQGFPRHLGIHTGGFVISHEAVVDIVPVESASMDKRFVIQWNKDDIEILGLMKIDVLGLGMLTAVRQSLEMLKTHKGLDWNLSQIPQEDRATYEMIQKADTVGVFQIESRAQMSLLPRLKPKNFYDLVIEIAIVRPGPIQGGMVHPYLRRRSGQEKTTFAHPALVPILGKTLGIPLFQEQIMQIAVAVAGFTPGEADELRRVVSSAWKKKAVMEGLRQRVINGMLANGLSREYADQIYKTIEGFSSYGFPESHSASFALITYASCYLKKHHPDIFTCSLLNSQPMGFYSPRQLIADAQRHGVKFHSLDVQHSEWNAKLESEFSEEDPVVSMQQYRSRSTSDSASQILTDTSRTSAGTTKMDTSQTERYYRANQRYAIRVGFRSVYGLREDHAQMLIDERKKNGPFKDVYDLVRRAKLPKHVMIRLGAAGALESLGLSARESLWTIQSLNFDENSLFFGSHSGLDETRLTDEALTLPGETQWQSIHREYKTKGFSLDNHPLAVLRQQLNAIADRAAAQARVTKQYAKTTGILPFTRAEDIDKLKHRAKIRIAGLLSLMQKPPTAKGICFVSLEDETGLMNVVITPDLYQICRLTLMSQPLIEVEGHLESHQGVYNIKAHRVSPLLELVGKDNERGIRGSEPMRDA